MKMNKFLLVIAGVLAVGSVHATQMAGSQNSYRTTDCNLLNEDIVINLSSNVVAGVVCDTTSATPKIALATCHQGGRTASRSVTVNTPEGCDTDPAVDCTGTAVETTTGSEMPFATTQNGTATKGYPGTSCAADETGSTPEAFANTL